MKETLKFLQDLSLNNNKEWFDANKDRYLAAKSSVETLAGELLSGIRSFDDTVGPLSPKDCTYGILAQLLDKTFYLIVSGASPKAGPYYDHIREEFRLYLDCFEGMKVGGVIIGENGLERGVMSEADKAEAYAAGKNA